MRVVIRRRGRRRDPERRAGLRPLRRRDARPSCSTPSSRGRARAARRRRRPPPLRRARAAPGARDGPHFRHRALFIGPNARAAVNEGRADYVPGLPVRRPAPVQLGRPAARRGPRQRHAARRARLLLARHLGRGDACRDRAAARRSSSSSTGRCRGRSATASSTSTTSTSRSRSTCRRTSCRSAGSATSSGGSASSSPSSSPTGDPPARDRRHPGRHRALLLRDKRDLGVHTEMFTRRGRRPRRGRRDHRRAQGAQPGQDRDRVPHGHRSGCTTSSTTTRWSRCGRSTSRTTPTSSARSRTMVAINSAIEVDLTGQVVADSIGASAVLRRRRPDGLHPRRGPRRRRAGRSSPCRRRRPTGPISRIVATLRPGAGVVTTRAHVRTVVTEYGVAELFGREHARAGRGADRDRPPGLPGGPSYGGPAHLTLVGTHGPRPRLGQTTGRSASGKGPLVTGPADGAR